MAEQNLVNPQLLRSTCEVLESESSQASDVAQLLLKIYKNQNLSHIPDQLFKVFQDDIYMCYESMNILLPEIYKLDQEKAKEMVVNSQIIKNALHDSIENKLDYAVKLKCTSLLLEIWYLFPSIVSQAETFGLKGLLNQPLSKSMNDVLKAGTMERDNVFKINAIATGFGLLDRLANKKNKETANVYKTLIHALLHNYKNRIKDQTISSILLSNFICVFKDHPTVPLQVLIEPFTETLMEMMQTRDAVAANQISLIEIEFIINVSQLDGISIQNVLLLLNVIGYSYFNNPAFQSNLLNSITQLIDLNRKSSEIKEFVEKLVKQACSCILNLKKEEMKTPSSLSQKKNFDQKSRSFRTNLPAAEELRRKFQRFNAIKLLEDLYELAPIQISEDDAPEGQQKPVFIPDFKAQIALKVKETAQQFKTLYKIQNKGFEYLFKKWSLNLQIQPIMPAILDKAQNEIDKYQGANNQTIDVLVKQSQSVRDLQKQIDEQIKGKIKKKALIWSEMKEPKGKIALKAFEEIQQIKQKRIEKESQD